MKSIFYKILIIKVIFTLSDSYAQALELTPTKPSVPTIESCRMYRQSLYEQRVQIYKRNQQCWQTKEKLWVPPYPKVQICYPAPPYPYLKTEGTPTPDCHTEEQTLCDSYKATYVDVENCFLEAKGSEQEKTDSKRSAWFNEKAAEYNKLEERYSELNSAIDNPGKFFVEKVTPRLPKTMVEQLDIYKSGIKSALPGNIELHPLDLLQLDKKGSLATVHLFDANKEFSQRGEKLSQEVYDFLFNKTVGNSRLYGDNEVIKAIQGTAAKELRKIHSSIIAELDKLPHKMEQVTEQMTRYSQQNRPVSSWNSEYITPVRTYSNVDCSVLDSPERTDIANNTPDIFEALLEKCTQNNQK